MRGNERMERGFVYIRKIVSGILKVNMLYIVFNEASCDAHCYAKLIHTHTELRSASS